MKNTGTLFLLLPILRNIPSIAVALLVLSTSPACCSHQLRSTPTLTSERREALRARTLIEFEEAVFLKPHLEAIEGLEADLAPLIVERTDASPSAPWQYRSFGAVINKKNGTLEIDSTDRVVYFTTSRVHIGTGEYRQVIYIWAYAASQPAGTLIWRGIRTTIGRDGFPLAWEVLRSETQECHLFVAASLERMAVQKLRAALPDRTFAVEREVNAAPDTIVLRVIEDGPIPMGPYVFLGNPAHDITTLLCRCSPSQVQRFAEEAYYDLVPLASLDEAVVTWVPKPVDLSNHLRWVDPAPRR